MFARIAEGYDRRVRVRGSGRGFVVTCLAAACARTPDDGQIRLSEIQTAGTHNSYHRRPFEPVHASHRYEQPPLTEQLDRHGVRQVELDVHLRVGGGFEVFHLPAIDDRSSCARLVDCLAELWTWSRAHPDHLPLLVWIEPKDEDLDFVDPTLAPIAGELGRLEAEIASVWPRGSIFAPDDLRAGHATLAEAVAAAGWPTLGALRGRAIFALLDSEAHRDDYTAGGQDVPGRLLFARAESEAAPYAALFKLDDPIADEARIRALVAAGFVVTTTADGVDDSDAKNRRRAERALASGAQYVSTNFLSGTSTRGYTFSIPGGEVARCSPAARGSCQAGSVLERLD